MTCSYQAKYPFQSTTHNWNSRTKQFMYHVSLLNFQRINDSIAKLLYLNYGTVAYKMARLYK